MQANRTIGWATTRTAMLWIALFLITAEGLHLSKSGNLWIVTVVAAALVAAVWAADRRRLRRSGTWESALPVELPTDRLKRQSRNRATLLGFCLLLVILALLPLIVAVMLLLALYSFVALRWRALWSGRRYYLVCSTQQGWHAFICNNLSPALPPSVVPIWMNERFGFLRGLEMAAIQLRGNGLPKPCMVEVKPLSIRTRTLHAQLLPLKPYARKDCAVQALLAKFFRELLEQ